ncbi:MAG TPA: hypothetical protein VG406_03430 [Isosphaeraceae bacterium]|nr:hypothetical protein [Isosphaeraceae bacterium]
MSGPIVRRYGFPNFEKIFGAKPVPHGAEEEPQGQAQGPEPKPESKPEGEERATETEVSPPTELGSAIDG